MRLRAASLPPSHRREYARWIGEAKKDETRLRRAAQAVTMLRESAPRVTASDATTKE